MAQRQFYIFFCIQWVKALFLIEVKYFILEMLQRTGKPFRGYQNIYQLTLNIYKQTSLTYDWPTTKKVTLFQWIHNLLVRIHKFSSSISKLLFYNFCNKFLPTYAPIIQGFVKTKVNKTNRSGKPENSSHFLRVGYEKWLLWLFISFRLKL